MILSQVQHCKSPRDHRPTEAPSLHILAKGPIKCLSLFYIPPSLETLWQGILLTVFLAGRGAGGSEVNDTAFSEVQGRELAEMSKRFQSAIFNFPTHPHHFLSTIKVSAKPLLPAYQTDTAFQVHRHRQDSYHGMTLGKSFSLGFPWSDWEKKKKKNLLYECWEGK